MRLKSNYSVAGLKGKYMLGIEVDGEVKNFEINESLAFLLNHFIGMDFSIQDIASVLEERYRISPGQAGEDAALVLEVWQNYHLL